MSVWSLRSLWYLPNPPAFPALAAAPRGQTPLPLDPSLLMDMEDPEAGCPGEGLCVLSALSWSAAAGLGSLYVFLLGGVGGVGPSGAEGALKLRPQFMADCHPAFYRYAIRKHCTGPSAGSLHLALLRRCFLCSPIALKLRDPLLGAECQGVSQASLHWPGCRSSHVHLHLHFYLLPSFASHDCSISVRGS